MLIQGGYDSNRAAPPLSDSYHRQGSRPWHQQMCVGQLVVQWLAGMVGEPDAIAPNYLEWDDEVREHIARHSVSPEDVEAVLRGSPLFFRNLPGRPATHVMLGYDGRGRALYVALMQRSADTWTVITAWESRLARRLLQDEGGRS